MGYQNEEVRVPTAPVEYDEAHRRVGVVDWGAGTADCGVAVRTQTWMRKGEREGFGLGFCRRVACGRWKGA